MKRNNVLLILLSLAMVSGSLAIYLPRAESEEISISSPDPGSKLRNVAFRRAAWHSSAANFENTAQPVTDGRQGVLSNEVIGTLG